MSNLKNNQVEVLDVKEVNEYVDDSQITDEILEMLALAETQPRQGVVDRLINFSRNYEQNISEKAE